MVQGRAPCSGGGEGENPPNLNGRPTKESELKIRVRPDCKQKIFRLAQIFSAYNHNNIPYEVSHTNIFVLQLVPCGGRGVLPSRKPSPPQATKQCLPRQRNKPLSQSGSGGAPRRHALRCNFFIFQI
ncbi:MAG: hypothetical protein MST10_00720 [Lentisphaeria bacterium]|nr:hypothetical protein [Lentisphaeria bacterium]